MRALHLLLLPLLITRCGAAGPPDAAAHATVGATGQLAAGTDTAYFASGCFWCSEGVFQHVRGVTAVNPGFSGGHKENPTYEEVCTGTTGHAETAQVVYDTNQVAYATLVRVFFASHDPTTMDRQGPDEGSQYRSIAFYRTPGQQRSIQARIHELDSAKAFPAPIVTEVLPFVKFWPADEHHQDFVDRNPGNGYVRNVSKPRIERFLEKMPEVVK